MSEKDGEIQKDHPCSDDIRWAPAGLEWADGLTKVISKLRDRFRLWLTSRCGMGAKVKSTPHTSQLYR